MPWAAAGAVAGALITANGAKRAASGQSDAAYAEIEAQERQAAQMRADLAPWTSSGAAAQSRLNQLLGISGGGGSGGSGRMYSEAELREQLAPQFTRTSQQVTSGGGSIPITITPDDPRWNWEQGWDQESGAGGQRTQVYMQPVSSQISSVDTEALNAEVQRRLAEQQQAQQAYESDPAYGSLLRAYRNGEEFDPGPAFSFTGKDLVTEPGYQFGLEQGEKGINRGQAARGNFLSGAAMKELTRFNEDYAGTKFNDAFNRSLGTYNTNLGARERAWGTNLGAYNDNRNRIYNFLSGTSSAGQNAATMVGNNAQQVANNVSSLATGAANAGAAGTIASSNAIANGFNQAANAYASNNLNSAAGWNNLLSSQGGGYSGYTGYTGGSNDPIANLNTSRGWTN